MVKDAYFGCDASLKSSEKDTRCVEDDGIQLLPVLPSNRYSKGLVVLALTLVGALLVVNTSNAVSCSFLRKILLKADSDVNSDQDGATQPHESAATSKHVDTMGLRKSGLRHNGMQVAGRLLLKLSDYSDPKSMDAKAATTTTTTETLSNGEMMYQGSQGADETVEGMDFGGAAQSVGSTTTTASGNMVPSNQYMEQQQQLVAEPPMGGATGGATLETRTNDITSTYANTPNTGMQQWQPAAQEMPQQQLTVGQLDGEMSTRYANTEDVGGSQSSAGRTVSSEAAFVPIQQPMNYQGAQRPMESDETTSESTNNALNYGDTPNMEMQQQQQQWQMPSQETKQSIFPPPEGGLTADKTAVEIHDRFSPQISVPETQEIQTKQWQSSYQGTQEQPQSLAQTTTTTTTDTVPNLSFPSSAQQPQQNILGGDSYIPPSFDNIANFPSMLEPGDVPVLWNIPKGGTTAINDILAGCLQLVVANNVGAQFGHSEDQTLQVFEQHGARFVNVETFTLDGIAKAKRLHLSSSGIVDAIVVYYLHEASELFTSTHRGFFFTVIRDPIERALLLIRSKRDDPAFAAMTIEEFAQNGVISSNWMTRWLSNQQTGPLSEQHMTLAKDILRTKFVIGIYDKMEKSMEHFEKYFGWKVLSNSYREKCVHDHITDFVQKNDVSEEMPPKDSKEYNALLDLNHFDVELYRYAKILFMEQAGHFGKISRPIFGTR